MSRHRRIAQSHQVFGRSQVAWRLMAKHIVVCLQDMIDTPDSDGRKALTWGRHHQALLLLIHQAISVSPGVTQRARSRSRWR